MLISFWGINNWFLAAGIVLGPEASPGLHGISIRGTFCHSLDGEEPSAAPSVLWCPSTPQQRVAASILSASPGLPWATADR